MTAKALRVIGDKRIKFIAFNDRSDRPRRHQGRLRQRHLRAEPLRAGLCRCLRARSPGERRVHMKADAPWIKTPQTAHFIDFGRARRDHRQPRHLQGRPQETDQRHPGEVQADLHDLQVAGASCHLPGGSESEDAAGKVSSVPIAMCRRPFALSGRAARCICGRFCRAAPAEPMLRHDHCGSIA